MDTIRPATDRLLTRSEVECMVGLGHSSIHRRIVKGTFPRGLMLGPNVVRWRESDILSWIDSLPRAQGA